MRALSLNLVAALLDSSEAVDVSSEVETICLWSHSLTSASRYLDPVSVLR